MDIEQLTICDRDDFLSWKEHWVGMPEYNNVKQPEPLITATFKFQNEKDYEEFKALAKKTGSKALAAWIGRKKYGKKKFQKLATKGRKRRSKNG